MEIFTLGYEGIGLNLFLQILRDNEIQTLVDVRQNPWSRKPGFSKAALKAACEAQGVAYIHVEALGCPTHVRNAYRQSGDWGQYTHAYEVHLAAQETEVQALHGRAQQERCCLMCFEADVDFCHRGFVAQAVEKLGEVEIEHLNQNSVQPATFALA